MQITGVHIHIQGIVQGVGFRPFVFTLAQRLKLSGWVQNTSAGVDIQVDGPQNTLDNFVRALQEETPPLAKIDTLTAQFSPITGLDHFEIRDSQAQPGAFQPISPDVGICDDCLQELYDPGNRRYRYPFTNCTNCGPRFTIIKDIPYDRPSTTMSGFPMCPACHQEYMDPVDRRFHAQPVACPVCGPRVWLEANPAVGTPPIATWGEDIVDHAEALDDDAILLAQKLLSGGKIIAIKGLGGFHLACDAENQAAVEELRLRKLRVDKPFAIMLPDLNTVEKHCILDDEERNLLLSHERPILILKRRPGSSIAPSITPGQDSLGVMLPYTPLHYLLFSDHPNTPGDSTPRALVMTSGNLSEEPIAVTNDEARQRLVHLADVFLMHNRPIHTRCDDSVIRVVTMDTNPASEQIIPLRRSRGYAPYPVHLNLDARPTLAVGAELKNTFCLSRGHYAFVSHHIGDLQNYETLKSFEDGVDHFEKLFRIHPEQVACDLHPDYLATRYAQERSKRENLPLVAIQHHHAHIAACMAENQIPLHQMVLGVAFDGTGYGADGAIWGGEILLAGYATFSRLAHLAYTPLPGGDAAIRHPSRIALAHLWQAGLDWEDDLPPVRAMCAEDRTILRSQLQHQINTPLTSSMGRLFDAVASLCGIRHSVNYEAQAAIELEALVDEHEAGSYPWEFSDIVPPPNGLGGNAPSLPRIAISPAPVLAAIIHDLRHHVATPVIAARFHNTVADLTSTVLDHLRTSTGIHDVALSGGVWQNITLLKRTVQLLTKNGFHVFTHQKLPSNDGGLSLGQAMVALSKTTGGE